MTTQKNSRTFTDRKNPASYFQRNKVDILIVSAKSRPTPEFNFGPLNYWGGHWACYYGSKIELFTFSKSFSFKMADSLSAIGIFIYRMKIFFWYHFRSITMPHCYLLFCFGGKASCYLFEIKTTFAKQVKLKLKI